MYLGALGANAGRMYFEDCKKAGGTPTNCRKENYLVRYVGGVPVYSVNPVDMCDCWMPEPQAATAPAPAPQPVNVTVSPTIQTNVSPQISPVFQQQFQPQNSPATAGTVQTGASQTAPGGVTPVGMQPTQSGITQQQLDEALARQRAEILAQRPPEGVTGQSQLPPAPAPAAPPPQAAPSYSAPPPMPEQLAPVAPAPTPQVSAPVQPVFDWKIAAIIGAGLFGVMALSDNRKRK